MRQGRQVGEVFIKCDLTCPEASYVSDHGESVRITTLDEVYRQSRHHFDEHGVSLVKIDVEGFEPNVLKGSAKLLSRFRPVIVCEVQYDTLIRNGCGSEDILQFLEEHGYEIRDSFTDPRSNKGENYLYDVIATPK